MFPQTKLFFLESLNDTFTVVGFGDFVVIRYKNKGQDSINYHQIRQLQTVNTISDCQGRCTLSGLLKTVNTVS